MTASKELGGGFNHSLFVPLPGEIIQFDKYFSDGLKPPTREIVTLIFQQISLLPVLRVGWVWYVLIESYRISFQMMSFMGEKLVQMPSLIFMAVELHVSLTQKGWELIALPQWFPGTVASALWPSKSPKGLRWCLRDGQMDRWNGLFHHFEKQEYDIYIYICIECSKLMLG